jgi:predicted membrane chloride channel (bestrophin family)
MRKLFKPKKAEDDGGERLIEIPSHEGRGYIPRKRKGPIDSNVPLQIMLYISSYNAFVLKNGLLSPPAGVNLTNYIGALQDAISGLNRIKTTPLPFAYQAHLRITLW